MRLATFKRNFFQLQLQSGEDAPCPAPHDSELPTHEVCDALQRGQSVQLQFEMGAENDAGKVEVQGERLWVTIAERYGYFFIGILSDQPACLTPDDSVYLCEGAEIPFFPEHVIGISDAPAEHAEQRLSRPPERRWPRH